jgi:hypothetical protein
MPREAARRIPFQSHEAESSNVSYCDTESRPGTWNATHSLSVVVRILGNFKFLGSRHSSSSSIHNLLFGQQRSGQLEGKI